MRQRFRLSYSAHHGACSGSQASFWELGIGAASVQQVAIQHPEVTIKDGPAEGGSEIPGDTVFLKGTDALVFSVCNVYFEADRKAKP